jgi:hypothetical protein
MCNPQVFHQHLFSLNHSLTQPHFTQPLVTQPILCAVHPTPRQHPCYPPTMSLSKPFSPLYPIITPTLFHDHPRPIWCRGRSPSTGPRAVFAEWDQFGFLFDVCNDAVWAILNTPPGSCGLDQIFRPQLTLPPVMVLLSVTPSNAPRPPGQPGWQFQLLSVQRSCWIA